MDELHFVPTPPVWEKIEAQIRKKKERRRFFLWLPILLLGSGAAFWWYASTFTHPSTRTTAGVTSLPKPSIVSKGSSTVSEKPSTVSNKPASPSKEIPSSNDQITTDILLPVPAKQSLAKTSTAKNDRKGPFVNKNTTSQQHTLAAAGNKPASPPAPPAVADRSETPLASSMPLATSPKTITTDSSSTLDSSTKQKIVALPTATDSTATATAPVKKQGPSKTWHWGISASAGSSGSSSGNSASGSYLANSSTGVTTGLGASYSGPRPPLVTYPDPSPVKSHTSLEIGLTAERQVSRTLSVSAGLGYSYYSTVIGVGKKLSQAAVTASNFRGSLYYVNVGHGEYYVNKFHFISLPVSMQVRLLKRLPVLLHAGLSLRRLLATNGLQYDAAAQVYLKDPGAFRKTQVFSGIGLDYALSGKRSSWRAGPQFDYGLTRMDANGHRHWYSAGLRVSYLFNK